jgi:hypothetical protein
MMTGKRAAPTNIDTHEITSVFATEASARKPARKIQKIRQAIGKYRAIRLRIFLIQRAYFIETSRRKAMSTPNLTVPLCPNQDAFWIYLKKKENPPLLSFATRNRAFFEKPDFSALCASL